MEGATLRSSDRLRPAGRLAGGSKAAEPSSGWPASGTGVSPCDLCVTVFCETFHVSDHKEA